MARVERTLGRYEESLRLYDVGLTKFAGRREMLIGRAAMLRRLGNVGESLAIYDAVLSDNPRVQSALNAKASIFIYQRKYWEALELLQIDNPKTMDEWRNFLLRTHLDWKTGYQNAAIERLDWALENCSFSKLREVFLTTRAAVLLQIGRSNEISAESLDSSVGYTAIVRLHVLLSQNNKVAAVTAYEAINDNMPFHYSEIVRELGIVGGFEQGVRKYNDDALIIAEGEDFITRSCVRFRFETDGALLSI